MSVYAWEEFNKGTLLTPSRYTTSEEFKIVNTEEVWYTIFGYKVWRKSFKTDYDEQEFMTVDEYYKKMGY